MIQQLHATILIAATLLAQCAPWSEAIESSVGNRSDGAHHQVLPGGIQQVATIRLITSQSLRLGRTDSSDEADPARLLPAAAAPSQPGYCLIGVGWWSGETCDDVICGPAVDRNPPLRL